MFLKAIVGLLASSEAVAMGAWFAEGQEHAPALMPPRPDAHPQRVEAKGSRMFVKREGRCAMS